MSEMIDDNVQQLVKSYYEIWAKAHKIVVPDLTDCLDFMVTECAEAVDVRLRLSGSLYTRSHPKVKSIHNLAEELFDVVFMACIALDIIGYDLMDLAKNQLREKHRDIMSRPDMIIK